MGVGLIDGEEEGLDVVDRGEVGAVGEWREGDDEGDVLDEEDWVGTEVLDK